MSKKPRVGFLWAIHALGHLQNTWDGHPYERRCPDGTRMNADREGIS